MNRILFVSSFFYFSFCSVLAQPTKGSIVLGGNLGFHIGSRDTMNYGTQYDGSSSISVIDVGPRLGYSLSEHLMIGIAVGYYWSKYQNTHNASSEISTSDKYSLKYFGPYMRIDYYFSEYWGVFSDLSVYYYWGASEYSLYHGTSSYAYETYIFDKTRTSLYINPGIVFNLNNRISMEVSTSILTAYKATSELSSPQVPDPPRIEDSYLDLSLNLNTLKLGLNIIL